MDLASASENDDKIAWYENTDGKGTLEVYDRVDECELALVYLRLTWTEMEIRTWQALFYDKNCMVRKHGRQRYFWKSTIVRRVRRCSVFAADLDGDGDMTWQCFFL